jgi:hypothetical protein
MARRRLTLGPVEAGDVPRAEHSPRRDYPRSDLLTRLSPTAPTASNPTASNPTAPIARVAAEAAGAAALQELTDSIAQARETGRMVLDLALDAIAPDHLTRDRIPAEDEDMGSLRESIRAHGQRTPIEVTPLVAGGAGSQGVAGAAGTPRGADAAAGGAGALPYGLISGWRRLAALKALHAETGDPRFATVQALVRRPETAADAYVAMVEENEIRVGLSHYERARVAALATARGIFPSEKAALLALFATASRPKRSRIRAFLELYHALDGALRFPAHLPERLGLALVERLRAGERDRIATGLAAAGAETPEAERAALAALVAPDRGAAAPKPAAESTAEPLRPGVSLETRLNGRTPTLTLKGPGVTPALAAEIRALLATETATSGRD